jgi:hypothetical protein
MWENVGDSGGCGRMWGTREDVGGRGEDVSRMIIYLRIEAYKLLQEPHHMSLRKAICRVESWIHHSLALYELLL